MVTLKGTVDTDAEKSKAARLAMVKGVTQVDNQLKVGSEGAKAAVTDSTITARLKTEMLAEEPLRSVHVETNNAVVSLSGTVPTAAARDRATRSGAVDVRRVARRGQLEDPAAPLNPVRIRNRQAPRTPIRTISNPDLGVLGVLAVDPMARR